jgi:hypothetical protein
MSTATAIADNVTTAVNVFIFISCFLWGAAFSAG